MTRIRTIYVMREADKDGSAAPAAHVFIETTAAGAIVYGVRASARRLGRARELAEAEFQKLRTFAEKQKETKA